jgi:phospholipid transport system substrate-binding protein
MRYLKLLLLLVGTMHGVSVFAQKSPVPMLEKTANQIIATLRDNKASLKSNPGIIYNTVEKYLLPNVDVEGMSRSVLGRVVWGKATVAEKAQFSEAFTKLVIRTYSTPLAAYSDETVQFLPIRGALSGQFVRVNSVIVRSEGQNIPLSYSLVLKNGEWKIYDMSVEGVSLLQSFRSQFAQLLQHANIQEVIQQMQKKQLQKTS